MAEQVKAKFKTGERIRWVRVPQRTGTIVYIDMSHPFPYLIRDDDDGQEGSYLEREIIGVDSGIE